MKQIDTFAARGGFADSPEKRAAGGVLVFGAPEAVARLRAEGAACRELAEPSWPEGGPYAAVLAVSGDDLRNLMLCRAAGRCDPGVYIVARCVNADCRGLYRDAGAGAVLAEGAGTDDILSALRRNEK